MHTGNVRFCFDPDVFTYRSGCQVLAGPERKCATFGKLRNKRLGMVPLKQDSQVHEVVKPAFRPNFDFATFRIGQTTVPAKPCFVSFKICGTSLQLHPGNGRAKHKDFLGFECAMAPRH